MALMLSKEPVESIPLKTTKGGVIQVGETRVTLDTVIGAFGDGATPEEIVYQYPSLQLGDVYAVVGYYLHHRDEVDDYLLRRSEQAHAIKLENERGFPPVGIRERLLARQQIS